MHLLDDRLYLDYPQIEIYYFLVKTFHQFNSLIGLVFICAPIFKLTGGISCVTSTHFWVSETTASDFEVMIFLGDYVFLPFPKLLSVFAKASLIVDAYIISNFNSIFWNLNLLWLWAQLGIWRCYFLSSFSCAFHLLSSW